MDLHTMKAEIDAVIIERLFKAPNWLADNDAGDLLFRKMTKWGLQTF